MIKFKLSLPRDVFDDIRDLPTRATRIFNQKLQATVKPDLQRTIKALMVEPGPAVRPFQFGTPKSRRFYFWKSKGHLPYQRTHGLINAWIVDISRQGEKNFIQVYNSAPAAEFVYGSPFRRPVAGHHRTGWDKDLRTALTLIEERGVDLIIDAWLETVDEALK